MEYCFLLCLAVSQQPNGVSHCLFLFVLWCLFVLKVLRSFAVVFCLFLSFSFHLEDKKMEDKEGESFKSYVLCCFCFLHMKKLTHLRPEVQLGSEFWFLLFSCLSSATKQGHLFFFDKLSDFNEWTCSTQCYNFLKVLIMNHVNGIATFCLSLDIRSLAWTFCLHFWLQHFNFQLHGKSYYLNPFLFSHLRAFTVSYSHGLLIYRMELDSIYWS